LSFSRVEGCIIFTPAIIYFPVEEFLVEFSRLLACMALGVYGFITVLWGLGIGSYLFIAAAIVKIITGVVTRKVLA
jgi:hypothetical protein